MRRVILQIGIAIFIICLRTQAFGGESLVSSKSESIKINDPIKALTCYTGDDGFRFTTIALDTQSLPLNLRANFPSGKGVSVYLPNRNGKAIPCSEAIEPVIAEIKKQRGELTALATRELRRFTVPDHGCQLFLSERTRVLIGPYELSAVNTFYISDLPLISPLACRGLVPGQI